MIQSDGYQGETLQVETEDGYLIKFHHIFPKKKRELLRPAFMMHGLFSTSADFLMLGPGRALRKLIINRRPEQPWILHSAYLLADKGFDVFLGNARGNDYGLKHKTLSMESTDFWNFSWHEIGIYDIAAMIDLALNRTRSESLFYFGHSQGTTALFVLLSMKPEYNQKISQAHLMGPSAFLKEYPNVFVAPLIAIAPVRSAVLIPKHILTNFSTGNPETI